MITEVERAGMEIELMGMDVEEIDKLYQEVRRATGDTVEDDFNADEEAGKIETPITQLGDI
jgi:hypothetical protein